jgi:hypothetical protein
MAEAKTQTDPPQTKTASEEQLAWRMPFPEMMAKMMALRNPDQKAVLKEHVLVE